LLQIATNEISLELRDLAMDAQATPEKKREPPVFVSYGHVDNEPPPGQAGTGFVSWLYQQLDYELRQLGFGQGLWMDVNKFKNGDTIPETIVERLAQSDIFLAIVSYNFVQSTYCQDEISVFINNVASKSSEHKRIFRVDKMEVANDLLPDHLRNVYSIPFYRKDPESGEVAEFYSRGRPAKRAPWQPAIRRLANDIVARLHELNPIRRTGPGASELGKFVERGQAPPLPAGPRKGANKPAKPVRTVYVAKPTFDLSDSYKTLVRELQGRNIAVVPDPGTDIPTDGAAALAFVRDALGMADVSIHLLSDRQGFLPDGLSQKTVPLQLAEAREAVAGNPKFQRLIWAPKVVPGSTDGTAERDPAAVLAQLDGGSANDEIDGDTAARFKEFVLQRLLPRSDDRPAGRAPAIYFAAATMDREYLLLAARAIKAFGAEPTYGLFNTEFKAPALDCDHIVFCWGSADEADVLRALEAARRQLHARPERGGRLCLLVYPPTSDTKQIAIELESFGAADLIVDAGQPLQRESLAALLDASPG
jgi:hypothetical protein